MFESKYFTKEEVACKCCGEENMQPHFMELMDSLRRAVKEPLTVTSGYRCEKHDKEVGGKGNHTTGLAIDVKCESSNLRYKIIDYATSMGFKRIGIGKTFIHLDRLADKPQEVAWLY